MSTMGGSGYTSLFDANGPARFAQSLGTVKTQMGGVVSSFVALQAKSDAALTSISKNFDALIGKAGQYSQALSQTAGPSAPGGGMPTAAAPSGWTPAAPGQGNAGGVGGQQGDGGLGGNHGPPASQDARQTPSDQNGGVQDAPRRFSFEPGTPSGAAMALGTAAVGAAQNFVGQNMPVALQASMVAQQAQTMFGSSNAQVSNNIFRVPRNVGILGAYGQGDVLGALQTEMTMTPFPNGGSPPSAVSQWQALQNQSQFLMRGGATATQAMGALSGLQTGTAESAALGMGIDIARGGVEAPLVGGPQSILGQVFGRVWHGTAPPTAAAMTNMLRPGGQLAQPLAAMGITPDSPAWASIQQSLMSQAQGGAAQTWLQQHPGQQLPTDPTQLAKIMGMDKGAFQQHLSTQSKQTQLQSTTTEGLAKASQTLDKAASKLLDYANTVVRGTHVGGVAGFASGILGKLGPVGAAIAPYVGQGINLASKVVGGAPAGVGGGNTTGGTVVKRGAAPPSAQSAPAVTSATQGVAGAAQTAQLVAQMLGGGTAGGGMDWWGTLNRTGRLGGAAPFFDATAKAAGSAAAAASATASSSAASSGGGTGAAPTAGIGPVPSGSDFMDMVSALSSAGFSGAALQHMVAIGIRESNGNPSAHNGNASTGDDSWGWFQVNYLGSLRAPRTAAYGSPQMLISSPMNQANAAWSISSHGTDFSAWSTNKGLSQAFLQQAQGYIDQATKAGLIGKAPTSYTHTAMARGSYNVDKTQLALVHQGERVVPAADNYSVTGRYQRLSGGDSTAGGSATHVHLNFHPGAVQLNVPNGSTPNDMNDIAQQFVQALSKPQILSQVRSS